MRIGAGIAALGALLNLIPACRGPPWRWPADASFPEWLAHVDPQRSLPVRAELSVAAVVITIVALVELRNAIAISGVAVLTYYAITNAAALTLTGEQRRWPRSRRDRPHRLRRPDHVPAPTAILTGTATLALGVGVRAITTHRTTRASTSP